MDEKFTQNVPIASPKALEKALLVKATLVTFESIYSLDEMITNEVIEQTIMVSINVPIMATSP